MGRFARSGPFFATVMLLWCQGNLFSQITFSTPGGPYTYTVPMGTSSLTIDMAGAQGANFGASHGGMGGRVQATLAVSGGEVVYIYVGGTGSGTTGGANGGGNGYGSGAGGGGASDIRIGGTALSNRVLAAAGGGGAGFDCGTLGSEYGGCGGGLTGSTGADCGAVSTCKAGAGGTQTAGGTGATCNSEPAGTLGHGGSATSSYNAGGGGGGYYGGGAGGPGGGGGGSSYIAGPGVTSAITTACYQSGNGYVIIGTGPPCNPPGTISGSGPVYVGSTLTLTETVTGGTWISSDPAIATVNPTTGLVTGVSPGTDTITYSVSAPCGGASAFTIVTINPLPTTMVHGVNAPLNSIRLIPNPNKGVFSVNGSFGTATNEEATLEVTDMTGHILLTNKITTQNGNIDQRIDLHGLLANGMYMLNLHSATQNTVFHFVIEQ